MTPVARSRIRRIALGAPLALGLLALLPGVALADNCSSLGDCWGTAGGAAGTAVGVGVATGVAGGVGKKNGAKDSGGKDAPKTGGKQRYQGPPGYHGPHPEYERNPSGTPGQPGYDPGTFKGGVPAPRLPPPRGYFETHPIHYDTDQIKAEDPDEGKPPHAIRG